MSGLSKCCPWLLRIGFGPGVAREDMPDDWPEALRAEIPGWYHRHRVILLTGPQGRGKTRFAAQLALEWARQPEYDWPMLWTAERFYEASVRDYPYAPIPHWQAQNSPLLILDDLCEEKNSDDCRCRINSLLFRRYENGEQRTVVISTLNRKALAERYGGPFVSRLEHVISWFGERNASGEFVLPDYRHVEAAHG